MIVSSIVIVFAVIISVLFSLIFSVHLIVLDYHLAVFIVFLELSCLFKPKIKTGIFSTLINVRLNKELESLVSRKDIDLWKELRREKQCEKINLGDIKKIKKDISKELECSKEKELISNEEIDLILKKEGLNSFLYSIKRTATRYGSFEQREKFVGSREVEDLVNLILKKNNNIVGETMLSSAFGMVIKPVVFDYKNKLIFNSIQSR